jgi:hypothetical protein
MLSAAAGARAGRAVVVVGVAYAVVLAAGMVQYGLSVPIGDPILALMEVLTITSALPVLVQFGAFHAGTAPPGRGRSSVALGFAALFALTTIGVHVFELTIGRATRMPAWTRHWCLPRWPSVTYAFELLAWDVLLGLALVFAAKWLRTRRQHASAPLRLCDKAVRGSLAREHPRGLSYTSEREARRGTLRSGDSNRNKGIAETQGAQRLVSDTLLLFPQESCWEMAPHPPTARLCASASLRQSSSRFAVRRFNHLIPVGLRHRGESGRSSRFAIQSTLAEGPEQARTVGARLGRDLNAISFKTCSASPAVVACARRFSASGSCCSVCFQARCARARCTRAQRCRCRRRKRCRWLGMRIMRRQTRLRLTRHLHRQSRAIASRPVVGRRRWRSRDRPKWSRREWCRVCATRSRGAQPRLTRQTFACCRMPTARRAR